MSDSDIRELKVVPIDIKARQERDRLEERNRRRTELVPQVVARAKQLLPPEMLKAWEVYECVQNLGLDEQGKKAAISLLGPQQKAAFFLQQLLAELTAKILRNITDEILDAQDATAESGPLH